MLTTTQIRKVLREAGFESQRAYTNLYKNCRTVKLNINTSDVTRAATAVLHNVQGVTVKAIPTYSYNYGYSKNICSFIVRVPFTVQPK